MTGLIPVSWGNFLNGTWLTSPLAETGTHVNTAAAAAAEQIQRSSCASVLRVQTFMASLVPPSQTTFGRPVFRTSDMRWRPKVRPDDSSLLIGRSFSFVHFGP